jgi:hypothetical protein
VILDKNNTSILKTALGQFKIEGEAIAKKFETGNPMASVSSRGITSQ